MNEWNAIKAINTHSKLSDQTKFRQNEINKIKYYFNVEIQERKAMIKKFRKIHGCFDHFGKNLIVLSAASGGISIICFTYIIVVIVGIASASFSLIFSLTTGVIKKLLKITINKKKKHNKILFSSKKVK